MIMKQTATNPAAAKTGSFWTTTSVTLMALMTALMVVSCYIKIPLPFSSASITAMTLMVNLIGLVMAPTECLVIMTVWMLLSVVGVGGSLAGLLGPAGGYRWGFFITTILIALFCGKVKKTSLQTAFIIIIGIPVIYFFGAIQMKFVTGQPWAAIMVQAVLPFIPLDIVKCIAAVAIAKALRPVLPKRQ